MKRSPGRGSLAAGSGEVHCIRPEKQVANKGISREAADNDPSGRGSRRVIRCQRLRARGDVRMSHWDRQQAGLSPLRWSGHSCWRGVEKAGKRKKDACFSPLRLLVRCGGANGSLGRTWVLVLGALNKSGCMFRLDRRRVLACAAPRCGFTAEVLGWARVRIGCYEWGSLFRRGAMKSRALSRVGGDSGPERDGILCTWALKSSG